jgi:hypothetical protein
MKPTIGLLIGTVIAFSCGGSLTDEQRKEMHEKMEMNKIVRVTEVEIIESAFRKGRDMIQTLEKVGEHPARIDSLLRINHGSIRFIEPGQGNVTSLEQQLMDAYLADKSGTLQDNVQKLRNEIGDFDSLLYTKPVVRRLSDGSTELEGVWNIWFSKKDLVIDASKQK